MSSPQPHITTLCAMPHRRVPATGERYTLPDGSDAIGDGHTALFDTALDGGRVVSGSRDGSHLCKGHLNALTDLVAATPKVVEWIRAQIMPSANAADRSSGYVKPSKNEAPLPLSAAAVDAADEEFEVLSEWVRQIADGLNEQRPLTRGSRLRWRSSLRTNTDEHYAYLDTAALDALMSDTVVAGFRTGQEELVNAATNTVARYVLDRIGWVAQQDWAPEMLTEVSSYRRRHLARWPLGDTARRVRGYRCTECHRESIVVHPPAHAPIYQDVTQTWVPPVPGGIGPELPPQPRPVLDWRGLPTVGPDGAPVVHVERTTNYAHPMLVACSDSRCGAVVDETYWEWARQIAESGKDMRDNAVREGMRGKVSGPAGYDGNGW